MDEIIIEFNVLDGNMFLINNVEYILIKSTNHVDGRIIHRLVKYEKYEEENTIKKDTN